MYLKDFLLQPKLTGSIVPSSAHLAETYVALAELEKRTCVVELGPGDGCLSKAVLSALPKTSSYFAIEINPDLAKRFRKNLPKAKIYEDSLVQLPKYLKENGFATCDCIISGIPWTNFTQDEQRVYMGIVYNALAPGGCFLTMAYFSSPATKKGSHYKQLLTDMFGSITVSPLVLQNIPPAYVYACVK